MRREPIAGALTVPDGERTFSCQVGPLRSLHAVQPAAAVTPAILCAVAKVVCGVSGAGASAPAGVAATASAAAASSEVRMRVGRGNGAAAYGPARSGRRSRYPPRAETPPH